MAINAPDQHRLSTEIAQLWPAQGQWTETDYFNLPDTSRLVELSEGEIFVMPPPSFTHQRVLDKIYTVLKQHVQTHDLGVTAFAPLAVRLWPGKIREPDVLFFTHAHQDRIGETVCEPPDLVMEIVSPGSRRADRHDKFHEYAQAGISEYWIVEPETKTIEVFALEDGVYVLVTKVAPGENAHSRLLPGLTVGVSEIFDL